MTTGDGGGPIAGRYRLIARLGSGGMGVVWQAYDERLHRTVAVKKLLMPSELTGRQNEEATRQAMREGRIAAKLQHPNAIMVYDVIEDAGQPYLVMEYLPSKSLSDVLAERGPIPPVEVAEIGQRVAAALASAHAAGVVHRDVKPGNVLLGHDGTIKITDFGISRAVEDVTGTTTGLIVGTPAYLSPEVAKGHRATFSSDVFSLGATLYTAIEGEPPFGSGDNAMALLHRVASGDVRPPIMTGPMTELLMQLLRTEPSERPTMAAARDALAAVAARRRVPATLAAAATAPITQRLDRPERAPNASDAPLGPSGPRTLREPPRNRRRPAALAAAAIAVLALAGLVLALLLDRGVSGTGTAVPPATSTGGAPAQTTAAAQPAPGTSQPTTTASSPAASPRNTSQTAQAAIVDYYALMPGNLQEGWTRLTPKYQQRTAGGFTGYQNFWNQMRSVRVSDVVATQDNVVEATVEYTFKTGKVVRERHRYTLVNQDGRWLIDESTVLSSVTL